MPSLPVLGWSLPVPFISSHLHYRTAGPLEDHLPLALSFSQSPRAEPPFPFGLNLAVFFFFFFWWRSFMLRYLAPCSLDSTTCRLSLPSLDVQSLSLLSSCSVVWALYRQEDVFHQEVGAQARFYFLNFVYLKTNGKFIPYLQIRLYEIDPFPQKSIDL